MEDLLWRYPDDFFPGRGFKPVARQFTLSDGGRLDVSFRDKNERLWVIEVKAKPIRYADADQVHHYAEKLRETNPSDPPIPALVAPSINSTVHETLVRWAIEPFEISEATFRRVATERGVEMEEAPTVVTEVSRRPQPPGSPKGQCSGKSATCSSYDATGGCNGGWMYKPLPVGYHGPMGGEKASGEPWPLTHYMLKTGIAACGHGDECRKAGCRCGSKGWRDAKPLHTTAKLHTSQQPRPDAPVTCQPCQRRIANEGLA